MTTRPAAVGSSGTSAGASLGADGDWVGSAELVGTAAEASPLIPAASGPVAPPAPVACGPGPVGGGVGLPIAGFGGSLFPTTTAAGRGVLSDDEGGGPHAPRGMSKRDSTAAASLELGEASPLMTVLSTTPKATSGAVAPTAILSATFTVAELPISDDLSPESVEGQGRSA